MPKYRIAIGDTVYEAEVLEITPPTAKVLVDGFCYSVALNGAVPNHCAASVQAAPAPSANPTSAAKPAPVAAKSPACVGEGDVTAPMPGKLIKFLVKVGDSVQPGQGVCLLEAMKMENQLPAPAAGVVKELAVREGEDVKQRTVLVRIEVKK